MLSFLMGLVRGIVGFLVSVLPVDPLLDSLTLVDEVRTGIGWLNFFIPVGDMLGIFTIWLGLLVLWTAVDWMLSLSSKWVMHGD